LLGVGLVTLVLDARAYAADELCEAPPPDPRLEELRKSDPTDPRIEVTSDKGDLGRAGDAILEGNVQIRTGQRFLRADQANINAEKRSIELNGNVEYLDPTLHVQGQGGAFDGQGQGNFKGAQFELIDRSARGSAKDIAVREKSQLDLHDVLFTSCPAGNDDWQMRAGEISIDQQNRTGT